MIGLKSKISRIIITLMFVIQLLILLLLLRSLNQFKVETYIERVMGMMVVAFGSGLQFVENQKHNQDSSKHLRWRALQQIINSC